MTIWMNGSFVDRADARISVYDHGLLYGDGIFEGIRSYNGRIFRLKAHVDRFFEGARSLMLNLPLDRAGISAMLIEAVDREVAAGRPDTYIRLVATRGEGPLGMDPFTCAKPSLFAIVDTIQLYPPAFYEQGVPVITSGYKRNSPDSFDPRIKSLNYLNNIMAKMQARQAGAQEAILLNHQGYVAECTGDNIITVKNGRLRIPASHYGALEGITLAAVLDIARKLNIEIEATGITLHDVYSADEVFLTGTGAELVPVKSVDGRIIGIDAGSNETWKTGPIFKRLRDEFRSRLVSDLAWIEG